MTPISAVREYYKRIDDNDIDWVTDLFGEDAVYVRADSRYEGKARIAHFFSIERQIRGSHHIDFLHSIDDWVVSRGEFVGVGLGKKKKRVKFVDIWRFAMDGRVSLRETYLALGNEYVKE